MHTQWSSNNHSVINITQTNNIFYHCAKCASATQRTRQSNPLWLGFVNRVQYCCTKKYSKPRRYVFVNKITMVICQNPFRPWRIGVGNSIVMFICDRTLSSQNNIDGLECRISNYIDTEYMVTWVSLIPFGFCFVWLAYSLCHMVTHR